MTTDSLLRTLDEFLAASSSAVVIEDGATMVDLAESKYSVSGEHNKCLQHFWSNERNFVRRVLDVETRGETLRVTVQKMGQSHPTKLEICRERDRRTASAKQTARASYRKLLERVLARDFPDFAPTQLSTAVDLEKSFGPVYARGLLKRGQSAFAVLGVNRHELQSSVDAALTFGILWLDVCRRANAGKLVIEGLKLFVAEGSSELVRARMAHLNRDAAKWHLYELEEHQRGNQASRDSRPRQHFDAAGAMPSGKRNSSAVYRTYRAGPHPNARGRGRPTLVPRNCVRCHGLEFARARLTAAPGHFHRVPEIVFGVAAEERVLDGENFAQFERLIRSIGEVRHAEGPRDSRLWRLHPERWLESLVVKNVSALYPGLDARWNYSQVPAFSASDRAMIDVLTLSREGRLAVLELKADEDIHLPLQGIDYWSRVAWHHDRGEFQKFGYFPGRELSSQPPLLMLVAPALHVHPTTDTLLHYVAPEIEWVLLGIDERWRSELRVVFRKRPERIA